MILILTTILEAFSLHHNLHQKWESLVCPLWAHWSNHTDERSFLESEANWASCPLWAPWSNHTFERSFFESGDQLMGRVAVAHPFSWCWCCLFLMLTCFLRTSLALPFLYSKALHTSLARVYIYQTRNYESFFLSPQKSMITSRSLPKILYSQSSPCH